MVKDRLIFTLLYNNGYFMLSRNFRLQKVGDFKWLKKHYNFEKIAFAIDELVVLNVSREEKDFDTFIEVLKEIIDNVFIPVAVGGGIRTTEDAKKLLNAGADKLVVNTVLDEDEGLVKELVETYGSQCIVGSVDFKSDAEMLYAYTRNGTHKVGLPLESYLEKIQHLGVGEVYLNSMERDGTGHGYALEELQSTLDQVKIPLILAGGAGKHHHLIEGIKVHAVNAVATANLFNFMGDGLPKAREELKSNNIRVALWS